MSTMTPARRKALEIVGRVGEATIGAKTVDHPTDPVIASAPAKWLIEEGYAAKGTGIDGAGRVELLTITQAGHTAYMAQVGPADPQNPAGSPPDSPVDGPGDGSGGEDAPETATGNEEGDAVEVPAGHLEEFEGRLPIALLTKVVGTSSRIVRPIHHGERGIAVIEWECDAIAFPRHRDGIKRVQTVAIMDLLEINTPEGRRLLNELKQQADPSPLPFKRKADAEVFGDEAVAVIFAGGARVAWPDDFPKGMARPKCGERLDVPGGKDPDIVVELLDMASGERIAVFDDEDDAPPVDGGGAGDEE